MEENLQIVQNRISQAARKVHRNPTKIKLIGVCKFQPIERIKNALSQGLKHLGHNYLQGLEHQASELGENFSHAQWHFVGHLQRNKVNPLLKLFLNRNMPPPLIHTLDRIELAQTLHQAACQFGIEKIPCLIQFYDEKEKQNASGRSGATENEIFSLLKEIKNLPRLAIEGLMVLPPLEDCQEKTKMHFQNLIRFGEKIKNEADRIDCPHININEYSMGMSDNYEMAIQEGSTMVRIGTALFGERIKKIGS